MTEVHEQREVSIVGYDDRYAEAFARLSRDWLERYFWLDERDLKYIDRPRESIIDEGGEIFFAIADGEVVGTCAAIWHDKETVELAKLAVSEKAQGRGIGRRLTEAVIEWARAAGARKVVLVSATKLSVALRLYERLGFVHVPLTGDPWYPEADVYMELPL
jgi:putative acetyltransferase